MLVTTKEMFDHAEEFNYAYSRSQLFDLDSARTYVETAARLGCPLILAFCPITYGYAEFGRSSPDWEVFGWKKAPSP